MGVVVKMSIMMMMMMLVTMMKMCATQATLLYDHDDDEMFKDTQATFLYWPLVLLRKPLCQRYIT